MALAMRFPQVMRTVLHFVALVLGLLAARCAVLSGGLPLLCLLPPQH